MAFSKEQLHKFADLIHIEIPDEKLATMGIDSVIDWLDKLQKSTGLDLRVFEDAITFKIALMVVEYMKYMEDQNF